MASEFNKQPIGYFRFPSGIDHTDIRLQILQCYDVAIPTKAVFIVPSSSVDGDKADRDIQYHFCKLQCGSIKVGKTCDYNVDIAAKTTFMMHVNCVLPDNENVVIFANGVKYYAKTSFIWHGAKGVDARLTIPQIVVLPKERGPSILDEIEKLHKKDMKTVDADNTNNANINPKPAAPQTEINFDIKLKKIFHVGIECWAVPYAINKWFEITLDRSFGGMQLVMLLKDGKLEVNTLSGNSSNTVVIREGALRFWFADASGKPQDFIIKSIKI
ncbi:hypothetical protein E24_00135 [Faustovirus]|nr:hypothetical protein PRJ_Fausto_00123 [Faustovirus]AMN83067.1 hypothetical protein E24_00135 [Faustovirus]AMN84051.1 hypothetical protein D5a_00135 [Faustovirus]AMN85037.1 hypothetical protein E23_00135 [Faustovirus]QBR99037.1 putative peptidoglycan-linked protein [Faustovirus mariensis]